MNENGKIDASVFTPTQLKIWEVLKDGAAHTCAELMAAVDSQADLNTIRIHITYMRKRLRKVDYSIMPEMITVENNKRAVVYRVVKLITNGLP